MKRRRRRRRNPPFFLPSSLLLSPRGRTDERDGGRGEREWSHRPFALSLFASASKPTFLPSSLFPFSLQATHSFLSSLSLCFFPLRSLFPFSIGRNRFADGGSRRVLRREREKKKKKEERNKNKSRKKGASFFVVAARESER